MTRTNHLSFTDLIRIAEGGAKGNRRLHLHECEECSRGFLIAKALANRWKREGKSVSVILGDATQELRNLAYHNAGQKETIGDPEILGLELHADQEGLKASIVSETNEVSSLKVTIYKLTKGGGWTEYKSVMADEEGKAFLGQIHNDTVQHGHERYVASVQGILRPKQKPLLHSESSI